MIGDARQVRVTKVRENDCFEPELTRLFVGRKQVFFNGNIHAEIFIDSAIDRAHAALPENFNNSISLVQ